MNSQTQTPETVNLPNTFREPSSYELMILGGLQKKPMYEGTVDPVTVDERRQRNRRARRSRRINRIAASRR